MEKIRTVKEIHNIDFSYKKMLSSEYAKEYVNVEQFLQYCKQCHNYGNKWACPPFPFDVMEEYWNKYKYIHLFSLKMYVNEDFFTREMDAEEINRVVKDIWHQYCLAAGNWIFEVEKNNPGSVALDGGHCSRCKKCSRMKNEPCRFGKAIRPAMDAIGANLVKTSEEIFNTKVLWITEGKIPEYFSFMVGLLSNSENIVYEEF